MRQNHEMVNCFWCYKVFEQRKDTIKRQSHKYGHNCCKNCFGKEQSFKDARRREALNNNPFKGKNHSNESKAIMSALAMGRPAWNKGLNKFISPLVLKYSSTGSLSKTGKNLGSSNPNWRGGSSIFNRGGDFFTKWLPFRFEIIKRDFNQCWICNKRYTQNNLEVHHLASKAMFPELKYDELNCIVLCKDCHKQLHSKIGRINFTYNDSIKYINSIRSKNEKLIMH